MSGTLCVFVHIAGVKNSGRLDESCGFCRRRRRRRTLSLIQKAMWGGLQDCGWAALLSEHASGIYFRLGRRSSCVTYYSLLPTDELSVAMQS